MPFVFHIFFFYNLVFFSRKRGKNELYKSEEEKKRFFQQHKIIDFPFSQSIFTIPKKGIKYFAIFYVVPKAERVI
jgi:hypothetical protein